MYDCDVAKQGSTLVFPDTQLEKQIYYRVVKLCLVATGAQMENVEHKYFDYVIHAYATVPCLGLKGFVLANQVAIQRVFMCPLTPPVWTHEGFLCDCCFLWQQLEGIRCPEPDVFTPELMQKKLNSQPCSFACMGVFAAQLRSTAIWFMEKLLKTDTTNQTGAPHLNKRKAAS